MKEKTTEYTIEAFETMLNDNKDNYPKLIMADQDSVFTYDAFEKQYQTNTKLYLIFILRVIIML